MNKKYMILEDEAIKFEGRKLYRIQALKDFGDVEKGQKGGYIQSERNLSHEGNCWIYNNAKAMDNSMVTDDATMFDNASMHDCATMRGHASMHNFASMHGNTSIHDHSRMYDRSSIHDYASMHNCASIHDYSRMHDHSMMHGRSRVHGNSILFHFVYLNANVKDAILESNNDFIEFNYVGKSKRIVIYLKKEKLININNCFIGNVDELEERVSKKYGDKETNYHDVIRMIRALEEGK